MKPWRRHRRLTKLHLTLADQRFRELRAAGATGTVALYALAETADAARAAHRASRPWWIRRLARGSEDRKNRQNPAGRPKGGLPR